MWIGMLGIGGCGFGDVYWRMCIGGCGLGCRGLRCGGLGDVDWGWDWGLGTGECGLGNMWMKVF